MVWQPFLCKRTGLTTKKIKQQTMSAELEQYTGKEWSGKLKTFGEPSHDVASIA